MTESVNISKEAVEAICKALEYPEFALRPTLTNARKGADMLRALSARVEELEAVRIRMLNEKLSGEWSKAAHEAGRVHGLNEALGQFSADAANKCRETVDRIEALKGKSND